jgi:hypothetical protein
MKQLLVLLGCCIILTVFVGCQGPAALPPGIAGTWRAEEAPWRIVLSPEGKVTSAVIPLGAFEIEPGQTTEIQGRKGEPGIFEAGNFEADYDPENRELSVSIKIKHIYLDMNDILEGTCDYFIAGSFSEDGKVWYADVFTALDLTVLRPEPNATTEEPAFRQIGVLKSSFDDGPEQVTFIKTEDNGNKK